MSLLDGLRTEQQLPVEKAHIGPAGIGTCALSRTTRWRVICGHFWAGLSSDRGAKQAEGEQGQPDENGCRKDALDKPCIAIEETLVLAHDQYETIRTAAHTPITREGPTRSDGTLSWRSGLGTTDIAAMTARNPKPAVKEWSYGGRAGVV